MGRSSFREMPSISNYVYLRALLIAPILSLWDWVVSRLSFRYRELPANITQRRGRDATRRLLRWADEASQIASAYPRYVEKGEGHFLDEDVRSLVAQIRDLERQLEMSNRLCLILEKARQKQRIGETSELKKQLGLLSFQARVITKALNKAGMAAGVVDPERFAKARAE